MGGGGPPNCEPLYSCVDTPPPECRFKEAWYEIGSGSGLRCMKSSAPPDGGLDGDACAGLTRCQPGLTGVQAERLVDCASDYCCTPFCLWDSDGSECTAPGESCILNVGLGICATD
jgi:hypothetical protein